MTKVYQLIYPDKRNEFYGALDRAEARAEHLARNAGYDIGDAPYWSGDVKPQRGGVLHDSHGKPTGYAVWTHTVH